jgi:dTDP-4-amino-4,6-dideoxygalactose transaminase
MSESTRLTVEADTLALLGGQPIRDRMLPYGRQQVDESDIRAVVETLRGDWLTNGPAVVRFEEAFAAEVGARFAVAVSSGTAALHAAVHVAGLGPGDEVILSPLTFLATANCLLYCGATPVFADVDPATLNLDPGQVERKLSPRTKAILPVHFAGLPCDLDRLQDLARARGLLKTPPTLLARNGTDG